ncbi:hypothetical protein H4V97_001109 [Flavobacterium sp. CG_23.5]|uniref:hypothetical protein n=1 Tax=unclassified Flavobacterium TaxID=196869 RepID=UPI0018CAAD53|nr:MULTISPECIES: hypothetical protein [unclassified Flavobacterium]MBG6112112.1 hypothetical protein [Flavobacterium sp. CG_9.10]MBP2282791.1 hypothetical protein [Flavobacterium sp. CG_23.5]
MIIKNSIITKGFIIAGLMNATVLIFSKLFTNTIIPEFDPTVMSNFGLLMIFIWGLAYMSVAKNYHNVKWLVGVFAIEKFIYGYIWINWILNNNVYDVYKKDVLAGIFYSIYGINDWVFFIFFLIVFIQLANLKKSSFNN